MSTLEVSLVLLTTVFWVGNVVYYFRIPIYEWLDNRVQHEPVTDRLRILLRKGRR
jgi:hypothetical protein